MGLIGSVLLLMRHRWAVPALGLSFLGAVLGLGYQIFLAPPPPPPMNEGAMAMMPWVIIIIAAALFYYAHLQKQLEFCASKLVPAGHYPGRPPCSPCSARNWRRFVGP